MAEDLLEAVERLQSRLSENQEPRKLLKTLKKLGEFPMTVDILVETGIGKAVNSLRKHEQAGAMAKDLVAKWKKLVPQSADRPKEEPRTHSRSEVGANVSRRRERERSPEMQMEEEMEEEEEEERGYHTNYSPSPPQGRHHYSPPQYSHRGDSRGGYLSEGYESPPEDYVEPEPEPEPSPTPPSKPYREQNARNHKDRDEKPYRDQNARNHADRDEKPHREQNARNHGDRDEERRRRHAQSSRGTPGEGGASGSSGSGSEGKKRSAEPETQPHKASKHSRHSTTHDGSSRKEKKGGGEGRPREHKDSELDSEEHFDTPTMSFESFLTYDAPAAPKGPKKKKNTTSSSSSTQPGISRPSHGSTSQHKSTPTSSSSSKPSKANGTSSSKSSKRPAPSPSPKAAVSPVPEKRRRVVEPVPSLPDIPLPAIGLNYRPLPSIDFLTPLSPQRRKGPVSNEEEDAGFTGKRMNSKMMVYSGAKTTYLPRMMSLYDQCIKVLQNNIDLIEEVGGLPYDILKPVLVRCTPNQLERIEEFNPYLTEETEKLWEIHCKKDFKRANREEFESWRETYLRLRDEQEARLKMLTQNIKSQHDNKPKGRKVIMAYVADPRDVKPPRDVKRRQDRFGTSSGSTDRSTAAAAPIKIRPAVSYSSHSADRGSASSSSASSAPQYSPPHTSRTSAGSGGGTPNNPRDNNKPQAKRIAPMMAKTIKAFKNRFSRR